MDDHRHCRWCRKPIPNDMGKPFCSEDHSNMHTLLWIGLMGLFFGMAAYFTLVLLIVS